MLGVATAFALAATSIMRRRHLAACNCVSAGCLIHLFDLHLHTCKTSRPCWLSRGLLRDRRAVSVRAAAAASAAAAEAPDIVATAPAFEERPEADVKLCRKFILGYR
jgi:hypothetical protein